MDKSPLAPDTGRKIRLIGYAFRNKINLVKRVSVMGYEELEIDIIPSPHDPRFGAHVGVRIRHKILNLEVNSTSQKTQYANKLNAMRLLKERFLEIADAKVDDNTFK